MTHCITKILTWMLLWPAQENFTKYLGCRKEEEVGELYTKIYFKALSGSPDDGFAVDRLVRVSRR